MKKIVYLIMCCLLLCSCGREKAFDQKVNEALDKALITAAKSERIVNRTSKVWHTAIFDHRDEDGDYCSDFNDALETMYSKLVKDGTIEEIETAKKELENIAKELSDCPDSRKEAYNDFVELITEVEAFAKLAIDPSGSYNSYSEEAHQLDNSISKHLDAFKIKYAFIIENGAK